MDRNRSRRTGFGAEDEALAFLEGKGYELLERNYGQKQGEIDLIMLDGGYLVFVEVKMRRSTKYGYPREYVDRNKRRRIVKTALIYIKETDFTDIQPRFDVVEIIRDENSTVHLENAFSGGDYV